MQACTRVAFTDATFLVVCHNHRADDLSILRTQVDPFVDQFAHGSADLLRYVGLKVPD